jgi:hypothetical protein
MMTAMTFRRRCHARTAKHVKGFRRQFGLAGLGRDRARSHK